jgi:hypothetical protein
MITIPICPDKTYVYDQSSPASIWLITHGLNKFPSVSIVDSANDLVIGDVTYLDENNLKVIFSAPFSGRAYLN